MADTKISALAAGAPAQATDLIPIARSGSNYSLTPANILNYGSSPIAGTQITLNGGSALSSYVTSSYTGTLTGVSGSVTGTVYYVKTGDGVILDVPSLSGTSNATTKTITGMPAAARPASPKNGVTSASDNGGAPAFGLTLVLADGTINVYTSSGAGAWTGSGTAAITRFSMSYTVN